MAGAGYKNFSTGDVLTATDLNTYAVEQSVMVFATSTARDTALASAKAEGMFAFLKDSDSLTYYDGSSWIVVDLAGDVTGVTAGSGLAGGGTSGTVTLTVDTDAKGDLIVGTGADAATKLSVGTNTYVLTADSSTASGLTWSAPTTGDITGVTAGTNIGGGGTSGSVTVNLAIDAAVDVGADGAGVDMTWHSATAGDYAMWDSSEEKLILEGTNGATVLDVTDGNVVIADGTLSVSGAITATGGVTGNVSGSAATVTGAAQSAITSVGTLTSLDVTGAITGGSIVAPLAINAQTGTTYTFVLADAGKLVTANNGSAQTYTVPPNSSVAYDIGTTITVIGIGAGKVTLAQGSGVTINSKDSEKAIDGQHASVTCIKTATDTWQLVGALQA